MANDYFLIGHFGKNQSEPCGAETSYKKYILNSLSGAALILKVLCNKGRPNSN